MKSVNLPDDLEQPNDRFFTHPVVDWFLTNAGSTEAIDWNDVVDPKDKDNKYKKYISRLIEITEMVVEKGGRGYFWLICSPHMSNVFASMRPLFTSEALDQFPLGYPIVLFMGILDKRWRIYSDLALKNDTMLMGCCFSKRHANYYCKIEVKNYK
jgi:hypothetical protein